MGVNLWALLIKRPVLTRMQGVVGAGGLKPLSTQLGGFFMSSLKNKRTLDTPWEHSSAPLYCTVLLLCICWDLIVYSV
jgi:hypothetical protein